MDAAHRGDRADGEELPLDDRLELLRYRCSTVRDYGAEVLIWDAHWSEPAPRIA